MGKRSFADKNALAFIIKLRTEKGKLALSNIEDFERKRKILRRILLSTIGCMHINARSKTISSQDPKIKTESMSDYLCILPLLWQASSKVEVLASSSLICHLKFLRDLSLLSHSKIMFSVRHISMG